MGKLYDLRMAIEKKIAETGQNAFIVKGQIGLKAGVPIGMIGPNSPDDPAVIEKLKAAAVEILKTTVEL
ncbi:MAG: hypothetical protein WC859_03385 [Elusimicrobiota bacterium]|jgi:hypothetical protein